MFLGQPQLPVALSKAIQGYNMESECEFKEHSTAKGQVSTEGRAVTQVTWCQVLCPSCTISWECEQSQNCYREMHEGSDLVWPGAVSQWLGTCLAGMRPSFSNSTVETTAGFELQAAGTPWCQSTY